MADILSKKTHGFRQGRVSLVIAERNHAAGPKRQRQDDVLPRLHTILPTINRSEAVAIALRENLV